MRGCRAARISPAGVIPVLCTYFAAARLVKVVRRHLIRRSVWFTVPGSYALIGVAYALIPPLSGLAEPGERLILAVRWLVVAFAPYAAVCLTILYLRFAEGAHNPLLGEESDRLGIHCRVMQNTLEQLVWFALCLLPLATYLSPSQARVVPVLCTYFAAARLVYWWGYFRRGTLGRAPGVQITFSLNISLYMVVLVLLARSVLSR
jgi:uncharacterized membrane protein YecN with MAPEG domain